MPQHSASTPRHNEPNLSRCTGKTIANATKNNINYLTFLKSNYKYKRRSVNMYNEKKEEEEGLLPAPIDDNAAARSPQGAAKGVTRRQRQRQIAIACNSELSGRVVAAIFSIMLSVIRFHWSQCNTNWWHPRPHQAHHHHHTTTSSRLAVWLAAAVCVAVCLRTASVDAGACWQTSLANGKCKEIYSTNLTRAECCSNQDFLFTENVGTEVEYFFKTVLGDGMECVPCRENCRNFQCGPNKKCVQRKGRPKCVCAPECGGAARRRKQLLQSQASAAGKRTPRSHRSQYDLDGVPAVAAERDTRSLSREITNINLDISGGGGGAAGVYAFGLYPAGAVLPQPPPSPHQQHQHQNQRKPTQLTHSPHEQLTGKGETKTKRLLTAGGGIEETSADYPTQTRRIQLISNIRKHRQRGRSNETNLIAAGPETGSAASTDRSKDIKPNGKTNKTNHHRTGSPSSHRHHHHNNHNHQRQQHQHHKHHHQQHDHHSEQPEQQLLYSRHKYPENVSKNQRNKLKHQPRLLNEAAGSILIVNDHGVGGANHSGGDMNLLDDGIDEKFNQHGFPNQYQKVTHVDGGNRHAHPVCGTDGRTYNTECQLKKRACRTNNPNLKVAYRGYCRVTCQGVKCLNGLTCVEDHYTIPHCIECQINCPHDDDDYRSTEPHDGQPAAAGRAANAAGNGRDDAEDDKAGHNNHNNDERNVHVHRNGSGGGATIGNDNVRNIVIDPTRAVCGVDGKTYKSTCDINRMICKIGRSIAVAYPGPCRADRVTCSDINCGPKQKCLVDYLTNEPRCVHCRYKCPRKRRPQHQRYEEGKICGVNNRNYNSWCEMRKESCSTGILIDVKYPGECSSASQYS